MSPQDAYGLLRIPHGSSGSPQGAPQDSLAFLRILQDPHGFLRTNKDSSGSPQLLLDSSGFLRI
eukprot:4308913-Pyramimonas_sp.AAC.1